MIKKTIKKAWVSLEQSLPDGLALRLVYYRKIHRKLNLNHPKSFTEKIQWLKLNYRHPHVPQLADKYAVRDFVAKKIGPQTLCKLYGVWDRVDDIPFDDLPDRYALKLTTGTHANVFCRDKAKFDREDAKAKMRKWMATDYFTPNREWAYKDIPRRIIAEEFLDDGTGVSPADYKFYCFDGKPEFVEVAVGRHDKLTINLLTMAWEPLPFTYYGYPPKPDPIPAPSNFGEMALFAKTLSEGFPFSRIDFYSIHGKTIFGEITWYPGSGLAPFQPEEWDLKIGQKLHLPTDV